MAIKIERIVEEDLNLGVGPVDVTMPGGGTVVGHKIGPHSFFAEASIATMDGGQGVAVGVVATVALDTEESDVPEWFDSSAYRFAPDIPGRYHIDAWVEMAPFTGVATIAIYKNGVQVVATELVRSGTGGQATLSTVVTLDGADYVTIAVSHTDAVSVNIDGARMAAFIIGTYQT